MLTGIQEGQELISLQREITQQKINLYAEASGDHNPIHVDESFASQTPLGGTVAHGMLVLAYISEMLVRNFGEAWSKAGRLSSRFKAPARPGDKLTVRGTINSVRSVNRGGEVSCSMECRNQKDEVVVSSEAEIRIDSAGNDEIR